MNNLKNFKDRFDDCFFEDIIDEMKKFKSSLIVEKKFNINKPKENNKEFINYNPLEISKKLKKVLPKYIFGQDHVVEKIVDSFKNNLIDTKGPKATFLFLGPPATGKTYLAQTIAKIFEGYEFRVFDMGQFTRADSGMTLYGSDFKFANSKPGYLTDFVLKNPKSVIVFDEIEKAHNSIQNALLPIFNNGKLVDQCGWVEKDGQYIPFDGEKSRTDKKYPAFPEIQEVDFSETVLIFTSNVGKELYNSNYFWDIVKDDYNKAEQMIIESLHKETKLEEGREVPAITPPFLSRLTSGELLLFKKLNFENLIKIVKEVLNKYRILVLEKYNIFIEDLSDVVYTLLLLSYAPRIDIRRLKSKIGSDFFDLISDFIVDNNLELNVKREVKIDISESVKKFFYNEILPLTKEDIIKFMFRKNLTLRLKKEVELHGNVFIYKITNASFEKIKKMSDYEDTIVFEIPNVGFDDIAGHTKAKKRLNEIVRLLKSPKKLKSLGIDIPKGILLYGPPGTGKTMLAKAMAKESGLPFLATTGTDLLNLETIDKVFDTAKEYAPSIVFIDEFDAIGKRGVNQGREIIINKLLSKINGFDDIEDVFIIAATNYPENIDPALLRSGRIDLKIEIKALDKDARKYFIENIINNYKSEGEFNIEKLVTLTTGMNGSDLEKVKREVGLEMLRNGKEYLDEKLLIEMINTVKFGEKIEDIDISKTLKSTAIHEAGHAVISKILKPEVKIEQITITPRSKALGFVAYNNEGFFKNLSKEDIKKELQILLAGRYAQIKKYGMAGIDSGASNDLEKATNLVYIAITEFGMDEEVGNVNLSNLKDLKISLDEKIRDRVLVWIKEAETEVQKLIDKNWDKIEKIAKKLLEEEILDEDEFLKLLNK